MDTSEHFTLHALFDQLGLSSEPAQIAGFIKTHPLDKNVRIENAHFWTTAQSDFLKEAILQDAEWAELVDHLDLQLRHSA